MGNVTTRLNYLPLLFSYSITFILCVIQWKHYSFARGGGNRLVPKTSSALLEEDE